jgi:hypothetical protein
MKEPREKEKNKIWENFRGNGLAGCFKEGQPNDSPHCRFCSGNEMNTLF